MILSSPSFLGTACLLLSGIHAFAPHSPRFLTPPPRSVTSTISQRALGIDPSILTDFLSPHHHDYHQHWGALQDTWTSFSLALTDASDTAGAVGAVATEVVKQETDNGWFGFLAGPTEFLLELIHKLLVVVGVSADAWGVSIVAMTIFIKIATYPLTKSQLESTTKMQAIQPAVKELQAKYQSNPEVMNQKIAEFYQANDINPLAGCLPSLVQIPIFIGLYRAVLNLAAEDKLNEPFLWLPNLEGPTYGADPTTGSDWILKGWVDGVPSLGWDDTIAFLILPFLLVVSQYVSMELMQPKTNDPAQQQSNAILKILPVMIGWFSLNVPAALCVYWFANNIITTALTLFIRNSITVAPISMGSGGTAGATTSTTMQTPSSFSSPSMRDKPAGFGDGSTTVSKGNVKPITAIDAEVVGTEVEDEVVKTPEDTTAPQTTTSNKVRGKKGKKRKN